ncbi:hypothetical protein ACIGKL_19685 [Pseudomonas sp. NPDC077186]|uniref:hypothetical protein n=1 Tax=Pseudomonas sp. NPDC077186 TaxID=3364421 RepID=UPI0037CA3375
MNTPLKLDDLLAAYEWVSAGEVSTADAAAYVCRTTGQVYWSGEGIDEALPEDIDDDSRYAAVPGKRDFDLGRPLVMRFVAEQMPESYNLVREYFHKRGAYSRFKSLLERAGRLEAWYRYEEAATEAALRDWCREQDLTLG